MADGANRGPRRPRRLALLVGSVMVVVALVVLLGMVISPSRRPADQQADAPAPAPTPSSSAGVPPPVGPAGMWKLGFDDEFDGSSLDRSRWRPNRSRTPRIDAPFNVDSESAAFSPDNVSVFDGALRLRVTATPAEVHGDYYPLTSGAVSTHGRYVVRDGDYVEARVKVPKGDGLWPAFWAVTDKSWPPEIDGFEFFDTAIQRRPRFNYHSPDGDKSGPSVYGREGTDYRNSWHTYGWLRQDGKLTPFVDGVAYPAAGASGVDDKEYFLILNLSVMADHHPRLDGASAQMSVDWVRAWRPRG